MPPSAPVDDNRPTVPPFDPTTAARDFRALFARLREAVGRAVVGQAEAVDGVLTALFAGGHVLLEGVPGLGKTLLARSVADALDLTFARIQFTPDLMPSDIVGVDMLQEDAHGRRVFEFHPGPIFAQLVLADEINRATPKTQSALLEAMQEHAVTTNGATRRLREPFMVLATRNPLDMEGTYPLPEAQLDRFLMLLRVPFPTRAELSAVVDRAGEEAPVPPPNPVDGDTVQQWRDALRRIPMAPAVRDYAVRLVLATHPGGEESPPEVDRWVRYGASPRGALAMAAAARVRALLDGRFQVAYEDITAVARPCLRHRVLLNFEAEASESTADALIDAILRAVPPRLPPSR